MIPMKKVKGFYGIYKDLQNWWYLKCMNLCVRQFRKDYEKLLKFVKLRILIYCEGIKDLYETEWNLARGLRFYFLFAIGKYMVNRQCLVFTLLSLIPMYLITGRTWHWWTRVFCNTKGQLISKCPFVVIVLTKIPTKKFDNFCPRIWKVVKS